MSKPRAMTDEQSTALFYNNLAHSIPLNPFNRLYSAKFSAHIANHHINISDNPEVVHKFCKGCSIMWIPGLTMHMRIKYKKQSRSTRYLQLKCNACSFLVADESLTQRNSRVEREVSEAPKSLSTDTWTSSHSNEVKGVSSEKKPNERGKKRKQNLLSAMLALKKLQTLLPQTGFNSLSLLEFMK